jgi:hypothetical protein
LLLQESIEQEGVPALVAGTRAHDRTDQCKPIASAFRQRPPGHQFREQRQCDEPLADANGKLGTREMGEPGVELRTYRIVRYIH